MDELDVELEGLVPAGTSTRRSLPADTGTGESLYRQLENSFGSKKEASMFLSRAGIDGVEYPSGSLSGIKGSKAKNYVVFDENAITIEPARPGR